MNPPEAGHADGEETAGLWVVILRIVMGLAILGASYIVLVPRCLTADEFSQTSHHAVRMFSFGTLTIDTRVGDVHIDGWDNPRLEIEAEKVVNAKSEAAAKTQYNRLTIQLEGQDKNVVLRTIYPSRTLFRPFRGETRLSVNYRIKMPFDANLKIKTVDGDVTVRGIAGQQEIRVNYGDVEVDVPNLHRLRSVRALTRLGYVQSDLHGEDTPGIDQHILFWNSDGDQNIEVRVRMGGIYIYGR